MRSRDCRRRLSKGRSREPRRSDNGDTHLRAADAPPGRPKIEGVRHVLRLRPEIDALARDEAERDGIAVSDVLVSAIESGLRPAGDWLKARREKA